MNIAQARFRAVDTETTGLDPKCDKLVEVAWARAFQPGTGHRFGADAACLLQPGIPIPPTASAIHHITDADVQDAPPYGPDIEAAMLRDADVLVAHNAGFDAGFLEPPAHLPQVCTYRIAMHLWPDAPGHSLQVLRYWRGLTPDLPASLHPHRALYDAICCAALLRHQLAELRRLQPIETVEQLCAWSGAPALLARVPFGKYRGERWSAMDRGYLQWVADRDFSRDVLHTANHHLQHGGAAP